MPLKDLIPAGQKFREGFPSRPCVLTTTHGLATEVGVAVDAGVAQHLSFDGNRSLEQVGVPVGKADPLRLALVEAEVAA